MTRTTWSAFLTLVIGFLVILIASLFVFNIYLNITRFRISRGEIAHRVVRVVRLARVIPNNHIRREIYNVDRWGLHLHLSHRKPKRAVNITDFDGKQIRRLVRADYPHFIFSMQLSNRLWLNIHSRVFMHEWMHFGIYISSLLLLIALLFLSYVVVTWLALPTRQLMKAAKRFGMDVQAPPLPIAGSPETRDVIRAFNEMQRRICRLLNDRTQMLAAISHDLRTPITRLQLRAEFLKGTPHYEKALTDLNEMEQMITSILSFARDYAQAEAMDKIDLNAMLATICDRLIDVGKAVTYHELPQRLPILGRLNALTRAFNNLIENAVKYGGRAEVELSQEAQNIVVKIKDEGPGIPDDQISKVFSPFYRVDPSRNPQIAGTGLGLTVARDIIRAHGGDIKLYNRKPHGLSVIVTLPAIG